VKSLNVREKICVTEDTRRINRQSYDATVYCDKCCARVYDPSSVCCPVQVSGSG